MKYPLITSCALACLAPLAPAQDLVSIFDGPPGGTGRIDVYDAQSGALAATPPELDGLRLLPIDFCGRNALHELMPDRPRRVEDVAGASRLRLQQGRGSLYRFARTAPVGTSFGFLLVGADGAPRILAERPGAGPAGTDDPFSARVAVAPDARWFLAVTTIEGGGDLLEIAVAGAPSVVDRTAFLPPRRVHPQSLILGASFGVAVTPRGVLRFDRAAGAQAQGVPFGAASTPAWFSGECAASPDTSHVVFTAGDGPQALFAWAIAGTGDARRAGDGPPQDLSPAGSALDGGDGPWLAISDDGTRCAWRTRDPLQTDCWMARVAPPAGEMPEALTSNARFTDTLDEVGLFLFGAGGKLFFAVGERSTENIGIEKLDVFTAVVQPGVQPLIQNMTQTSGETSVPFNAIPTIEPSRMVRLPAGDAILVHDDGGSSGPVYALRDGQVGADVVMTDVKDLYVAETAGNHLMLYVRRGSGAREIHRAAQDLLAPPVLVASTSGLATIDRAAPRRDGWMAYVVSDPAGAWLDRTHLPSGTTEHAAASPAAFGPATAWTRGGRLVCTRITGGAYAQLAWEVGSTPIALAAPATAGQVLPGP